MVISNLESALKDMTSNYQFSLKEIGRFQVSLADCRNKYMTSFSLSWLLIFVRLNIFPTSLEPATAFYSPMAFTWTRIPDCFLVETWQWTKWSKSTRISWKRLSSCMKSWILLKSKSRKNINKSNQVRVLHTMWHKVKWCDTELHLLWG